MYTLKELFQDDAAAFYDVVHEALDREVPYDILPYIFEKLPRHIRDTAHSWGLSDTPFKDDAYEWILVHKHELLEGF